MKTFKQFQEEFCCEECDDSHYGIVEEDFEVSGDEQYEDWGELDEGEGIVTPRKTRASFLPPAQGTYAADLAAGKYAKYGFTKSGKETAAAKRERMSKQSVAEAQTAKAGIVQTEVYGTRAYHARCMEPGCDWETRRYDKIQQAQAAAKKHSEKHFAKKQSVKEEADKSRVKLGKPFLTPGGPKKRAVYVKNDRGNVVKVSFGDPNLEIKRDNPERRKNFRARHNCDQPGPRWKAKYWSCKYWSKTPVSKLD